MQIKQPTEFSYVPHQQCQFILHARKVFSLRCPARARLTHSAHYSVWRTWEQGRAAATAAAASSYALLSSPSNIASLSAANCPPGDRLPGRCRSPSHQEALCPDAQVPAQVCAAHLWVEPKGSTALCAPSHHAPPHHARLCKRAVHVMGLDGAHQC